MVQNNSLLRILAEVDRLGNELGSLFIVGRLTAYDGTNGLAQIESLNFDYGTPLYVDNAIVLGHGDTFVPVPVGQIAQPSESVKYEWNANIGDLVLVIRVSEQIYVLVGTVNALKNVSNPNITGR